jgi:hypothetical protein
LCPDFCTPTAVMTTGVGMSGDAEAMGEISSQAGVAPALEIAPDPAAGATGFLPPRPPRAPAESVAVRVIATTGVIGISTAVGAILAASSVSGWIIALVVSTLSVVLAAVLWRSRRL